MTFSTRIRSGRPLAAAEPSSERPATLDLTPPRTLPAEITLDEEEARIMRTALTRFLDALERPAQRAALTRGLLASVDGDDVPARPVDATSIPASAAEVEDFDRYFRVRRITANSQGLALLRGLLQTSSAVFALTDRAPGLPQDAIEPQVAGFAAYAALLGRVCGLGRLR